MIKEYKYIKDHYSWNEDFETDSESAKGTNSPKVYDLRTPQKKSRITRTILDTTSDKLFLDKPFTDKHARIVDPIPIKSTMSKKLASIPSSKQWELLLWT